MKKCSQCNSEMDITLRKVYFNKDLKVHNVPVYSCESCKDFILVEQVKVIITVIIKENENSRNKATINFENYSELAQLLVILANKQKMSQDTEELESQLRELLESDKVNNNIEASFDKEIHEKIYKHVH